MGANLKAYAWSNR